jgi:hypothetical protein
MKLQNKESSRGLDFELMYDDESDLRSDMYYKCDLFPEKIITVEDDKFYYGNESYNTAYDAVCDVAYECEQEKQDEDWPHYGDYLNEWD